MPRTVMTCNEISGLSMIRTPRSVPTRAPQAGGPVRMPAASARNAQVRKIVAAGLVLGARRGGVAVKRAAL